MVLIEATQEIPAFVAPDMQVYGGFSVGERAEVPERIGGMLVKTKLAKEVVAEGQKEALKPAQTVETQPEKPMENGFFVELKLSGSLGTFVQSESAYYDSIEAFVVACIENERAALKAWDEESEPKKRKK